MIQTNLFGSKSRIDDVNQDVTTIVEAFESEITKVGLFGSALTKHIDDIDDIDMAIFMKDVDLERVRKTISNLALNHSIFGSDVNLAYGGDSPKGMYDIVILDSDSPNAEFMDISGDSLSYLKISVM